MREHSNHVVIQKLKTNKPITEKEIQLLEDILFSDEAIGTKQDYVNNYGNKPLGVFIRGIVGLDRNAAQAHFAAFDSGGQSTCGSNDVYQSNYQLSHTTWRH